MNGSYKCRERMKRGSRVDIEGNSTHACKERYKRNLARPLLYIKLGQVYLHGVNTSDHSGGVLRYIIHYNLSYSRKIKELK